MIPRSVSVLALTALLGACAGIGQKDAIDSQAGKPVRVCTEERGCNSVSRADLRKERMPEPPTQEEARIASLEAKAQEDPRAAFDLALRFFRGDGISRDTYKAITWMRSAAERGNTKAQVALGRFYLSGVEEMGADPAEAESWLSAAAGKGDAEATRLLAEAQKAKADDIAWRRWVDSHRALWLGYWWNAYHYYTYWSAGSWLYS